MSQTPTTETPKRSGALAWMARNSVASNLLMFVLIFGGLIFRTRKHVFAARLTFGFVFGTGDVDVDLHIDFRVQHNANREDAKRFQRLVETHLGAFELHAAF